MNTRTNTHRLFVLAALVWVTPAWNTSAVTLQVPAQYPTIQSCLDAAVSGQDECVVAPGTYNELISFLGKAVTLRSSDGPGVTIIDGFGLVGAIVTCINGEGPDTVLDGFTIMRGTAAQFAGEYGGGGMLNFQSTATVTNCVFQQNSGNIGAAMFNYGGSSPTIMGCSFLDNNAHLGGAIINYLRCSPVITNTTFEDNNAATGGGGAIENFLESHSLISDCTFRRNTAYRGGAVYNDWRSPTSFTHCTFEENAATYGGAIYDTFHSPSFLDHCVFVRNTALENGGAIGHEHDSEETIVGCEFTENEAFGVGGAIANSQFSSWGELTIVDSRFAGNKAADGGALCFRNDRNVFLSNCVFEGNQAAGKGGAIYYEDTRLLIAGCCFTGNTATNGGGLSSLAGNSTITNSTFEKNVAANWGGGIYDAYEAYSNATTEIRDCIFLGNTAREGGGYYDEAVEMELLRCEFTGNAAENGAALVSIGDTNQISQCLFDANTATGYGGGVYLFSYREPTVFSACTFRANSATIGGGIYNVSADAPLITESAFVGNLADVGGAIFHDGMGAVNNCRFLGNSAIQGGALWIQSAGVTTASSLFVGNSAYEGGALTTFENTTLTHCTLIGNEAVYTGGVASGWAANVALSNCILRQNSPDHIQEQEFTATFQSSNVLGGVPPHCTDAGGNIDLDPLFLRSPFHGGDGWGDNLGTPDIDESVNDDYGDLRVQPDSPCINAGDPNFVAQPGETDLDGHARVLCGRVDMGAYEFGIGDFDCDQAVELTDFSAWPACSTDPVDPALQSTIDNRGSTMGCESFDFNSDGDIDLQDLAQLMAIVAH